MTVDYRSYIVRDTALCGGDPVIKGTQVSVRAVLTRLAEGVGPEEILGEFPALDHDALRAVIAFAAQAAEENLLWLTP